MGVHHLKKFAVFLDRDGVLSRPVIRDGRPFSPQTVDDFELYPEASEGCARLKDAGFTLVVITNQPDVGRGAQTRAVIEAMHARLRAAIPALDGIEVCYHAGRKHGDVCDCRKPKPGMLFRAAASHDLDLRRSYVIGDRWRDVDCAHAAGCRAVFINRGYAEPAPADAEFTVSTFSDAVAAILGNGLSDSASQD